MKKVVKELFLLFKETSFNSDFTFDSNNVFRISNTDFGINFNYLKNFGFVTNKPLTIHKIAEIYGYFKMKKISHLDFALILDLETMKTVDIHDEYFLVYFIVDKNMNDIKIVQQNIEDYFFCKDSKTLHNWLRLHFISEKSNKVEFGLRKVENIKNILEMMVKYKHSFDKVTLKFVGKNVLLISANKHSVKLLTKSL